MLSLFCTLVRFDFSMIAREVTLLATVRSAWYEWIIKGLLACLPYPSVSARSSAAMSIVALLFYNSRVGREDGTDRLH